MSDEADAERRDDDVSPRKLGTGCFPFQVIAFLTKGRDLQGESLGTRAISFTELPKRIRFGGGKTKPNSGRMKKGSEKRCLQSMVTVPLTALTDLV